MLSQLVIRKQLEFAKEYYLNGNRKYLNAENCFANWTDRLNCISGPLFIVAILLMTIFILFNIH